MNEFLDKVGAAFTPPRRKVIYHVATAAVFLLVVHGLITAQTGAQDLAALSYLLFGGTFQLAAAHVKEGDQ